MSERPVREGASRVTASLGWTRLGVIIWTSLASSIYFSLGIVSGHALGLTPLVYLVAGLFFAVTAMTYLEGAKMHPEHAGSTVFARYAFNELASFVAAAAVLLDYVILIAVCALTAADYFATFIHPFGHGAPRVALALAVIAYVAISNVLGFSPLQHGAPDDRDRRLRHRDPARRDRHRAGAVLPPPDDHRPRPSRQRADVDGRHLRAHDHHRRVHVPGVGLRGLGRALRQPRQRAPHHLGGEPDDPRDLRRHGGRRGHRGPRRGRAHAARRALPRRARDRHRRALPPARAGRHPQVHGRRRRGRDARRGRSLRDARTLAAGLLARHQPPDPERGRTPAPAALDAVRADCDRSAGRRRARALGQPRLPLRHLRLRRDARVHDRAPLDLRAALPRARPPAALPDARRGARARRRAAAAGRRGRAALGSPAGSP